MIKLFSVLFCISISIFCSCNYYKSNLQQEIKSKQVTNVIEIDGVYEFVSETVLSLAPEKIIEKKDNNEWKGLWFFTKGYFSQNIMKIDRSSWMPGNFPLDKAELGFDTISGKYRINENTTIQFNKDLTLFPGNFLSESFSYTFESDLLILTQNLSPNTHTTSKGKRIIILKKLK